MKILFLTLTLVLSFLANSHAQQPVAGDITELLPRGKYLAKSFLPALPELTPREKELQNKIVKATMEHASWFRDSMKNIDDMGKMLEKLGITPQEMEEYEKISSKDKTGIRITGADTLEIIRSGNTIFFRGHGASRPLDSLQINLDANNAVFRGQVMPFKGTAERNAGNDLFKLSKGYEYTYEPPLDATGDPMHVIDNLTRFTLIVGRVQTTGEKVLVLMALKNVDKRTVLSINVPLLFE